jgi:hypothetical protein
VAFGAYQHAAQKGAVYVYTESEGTWSHATALLGSDLDAELYLCFGSGVSVSYDGSTLVAGAYGWSGGSTTGCGAAWAFTRSAATSWVLKQQIRAADGMAANGDCFGYSVAISSDARIIAVGAYLDDTVSG